MPNARILAVLTVLLSVICGMAARGGDLRPGRGGGRGAGGAGVFAGKGGFGGRGGRRAAARGLGGGGNLEGVGSARKRHGGCLLSARGPRRRSRRSRDIEACLG